MGACPPKPIHLLLTPRDAPDLALFVKSFAQRYAQHRNRRRDGSGKLFEQQFYSRAIEDDTHYGCTLAYIDDNPRRAHIVDHPRDYRWSSYHVYASPAPSASAGSFPELITPAGWYLDLSESETERAARYAQWVEDCNVRARTPRHVDAVRALEHVSERYTRRLRRPDDTSAR